MNKNKSKSQRNNSHHNNNNNNNNTMHPNSNNTSKKRRRNKKSKTNNNNNNNNKKLSYASRISSASNSSSIICKKPSLRIRTSSSDSLGVGGGSRYNKNNRNTIEDIGYSLHGTMSREELLKIRMQQRDICYVAGLPKSICNRQILASKKWFGQFGKIRDITITDNQNCIRTNWMCVHIKYFENISALKAVKYMNHKKLDDGRVLEANYGTQRYCEFFINNKRCHKSNCPFRHSWCKLNEIVNFNNHHQIIPIKQPIRPQPTIIITKKPVSISIQPIQPPVSIQQQPIQHVQQQVESVPSTQSLDSNGNDRMVKNNNDIISIEPKREREEEIQIPIYDGQQQQQEEEIQIEEEEAPTPKEDLNKNDNLNKLNAMEIEMNELYSELHAIKLENNEYKSMINDQQTELVNRDNEILKLQKISRKLVDAHTIIKAEKDKLIFENNELKRRFITNMNMNNNNVNNNNNNNVNNINNQNQNNQNISISLLDYTLWEWHDVYTWLCNIRNGYFKKYSDLLLNNLKLENIDGSCIKCLSTTDIHRIGITDYKDKQIILEHIHLLKSNLGLDNLIDDIISQSNHNHIINNINHPITPVHSHHSVHSQHSQHSHHSHSHSHSQHINHQINNQINSNGDII